MERKQPWGMRERTALTAALLMCLSRPWRLFCTRLGRRGPGWREVSNVNALWGLLALFLFAALGRSPLLWAAFQVAVLSQLCHRLCVSRAGHSRFMGESHLTRVVPGPLRARWVESVVAVGIGLAVFGADRAAGWWFVLAGCGNYVTVRLAAARETHATQDVLDAVAEGAARAARLERGKGVN